MRRFPLGGLGWCGWLLKSSHIPCLLKDWSFLGIVAFTAQAKVGISVAGRGRVNIVFLFVIETQQHCGQKQNEVCQVADSASIVPDT